MNTLRYVFTAKRPGLLLLGVGLALIGAAHLTWPKDKP